VTDSVSATSLDLTSEDMARLNDGLPPNAEVSSELSPAPPFRS
jgi:hypothetical protein